MRDSTFSVIKTPNGIGYLTRGAIAFMIFEEILEIPVYQITNTQIDLLHNDDLTGYPIAYLHHINTNTNSVYLAVKEWYKKNEYKLINVENSIRLKGKCNDEYGITKRLVIKN